MIKKAYLKRSFGDKLYEDPGGRGIMYVVYIIFVFGAAFLALPMMVPSVPAYYLWVFLAGMLAFLVGLPAIKNAYKYQRYSYFAYGFLGLMGIVAINLHFVKLVYFSYPPLMSMLVIFLLHVAVVLIALLATDHHFHEKESGTGVGKILFGYLVITYIAIEVFTYAGFFTKVFLFPLVLLQMINIYSAMSFRNWYLALRYKEELKELWPAFGTTEETWKAYDTERTRILKEEEERQEANKKKREEARERNRIAREAEQARAAAAKMATADHDDPPRETMTRADPK